MGCYNWNEVTGKVTWGNRSKAELTTACSHCTLLRKYSHLTIQEPLRQSHRHHLNWDQMPSQWTAPVSQQVPHTPHTHSQIRYPCWLTRGFPTAESPVRNLDLTMVQQEKNNLSCELQQYISSLQHTALVELQCWYGYRILRKYRRHKNVVINNLYLLAACVPPCPSFLFSCLLKNFPPTCDGMKQSAVFP